MLLVRPSEHLCQQGSRRLLYSLELGSWDEYQSTFALILFVIQEVQHSRNYWRFGFSKSLNFGCFLLRSI